MSSQPVAGGFEEVCAEVSSRLRARFAGGGNGPRHARRGGPGPRDGVDPTYLEYLDSLKENRPAVLEYAVGVIELGEHRAPNVPAPVLRAARLAARSGVTLDTVLRRYSAGNAEQTPVLATSPLTMFNGGVQGGRTTIFIHAFLTVPVPAAVVTPIVLTPIHRKFTYRGEKHSYLTAACPRKALVVKGRVLFDDDTLVQLSRLLPCTQAR
ncbi:MAG TPA: hypothetical protein VFN18_12200 [Solirubrobacterales bacterium]|nr:hypothetical protein [Solirubrobacterales bacterium]